MAAAVIYLAATALFKYAVFAVLAYSIYDANRQARKAKQQAKDAYNASLRDRLVMTATTSARRSRVYGKSRNVDGIIFKGTHGSKSEFYTLVVALAGHECDAIEEVYYGDKRLDLESDGSGGFWVTNPPFQQSENLSASERMTTSGSTATVTLPHAPIIGSIRVVGRDSNFNWSAPQANISVSGSVVTVIGVPSEFSANIVCQYQYANILKRARIWKYLGTADQDIGNDLLKSRFPDLINTAGNDDRFAGICCVVCELEFDQNAFPTGVPSVSALLRGAKCKDVRTGLTVWTENPAIIARDWALYQNGGACLESELDDAKIIAAANACDVMTNFTRSDGEVEPRPLYQCGIVCALDANPDQWMSEIVESMAGKWEWSGGVLTMVAGVYRSPVAHITEDWCSDAEDIEIIPQPSRNDIFNVVRPSIALAEPVAAEGEDGTTQAYEIQQVPEVRAPAYIEADGQELSREVELGGVTHNVHAQHVCGVMMRESRDGLIIKLPCNLRAFTLELFDVVTLTLPFFGFDHKEFEVIGWKFSMEGGVVLTLKEFAASFFDPAGNFDNPNASPNTTLPLPWYVPGVNNVEVISDIEAIGDGTPQTRVLVTWDVVQYESVRRGGRIEVQWNLAGDDLPVDEWESMKADGGASSATILGLKQGEYYLIRVRAVNALGVKGPWCLHQLHRVAEPPNDSAAAAEAAQEAAEEALARLDDIASDNVLTPGEKPAVMLDFQVITSEQAGIDAKADAQGLSTLKSIYDTAVSALSAYLATLTTPVAWNSLTGNTTIVGPTFRGKFSDVYIARQNLLNEIAVVIASGAVSSTNNVDYGITSAGYSGAAPSGLTEVSFVDPIQITLTNPGGTIRVEASTVATFSTPNYDAFDMDSAYFQVMLVDNAAPDVPLDQATGWFRFVVRPATVAWPFPKRLVEQPIRLFKPDVPNFTGTKTFKIRFFWKLARQDGEVPTNSIGFAGTQPAIAGMSGSISTRVLKA